MKFNPFTGTLDLTGSGGGTPGGSDTQVQFNDNGAFGATQYHTTDKNWLMTLSRGVTATTPTNLSIVFDYNAAYGYPTDSRNRYNARIYSYVIIGGVKKFSSDYVEGTDATPDGSDNFRIHMTWDAVTGVDGYRVVVFNEYYSYNYDYYYDVATNSFIDNLDKTYLTPVDVSTISPTKQVLKADGYVGIDTTGALVPTEALDVQQNLRVRRHMALGSDSANIDNASTTSSIGLEYLETVTDASLSSVIGMEKSLTANFSTSPSGSVIGDSLTVVNGGTYAPGNMSGQLVNVQDSTSGVNNLIGAQYTVTQSSNVTANTGYVLGIDFSATKNGTGSVTNVFGARFIVSVPNSGAVTNASGAQFNMYSSSANSAANITNIDGGYFNTEISGRGANTLVTAGRFRVNLRKDYAVAATVTEAAIFYGQWSVSTVAPTTAYGIYLPSITGGSTNYAIKTGTGNHSFGDKITTYNAINTTGWGVPAIYASGRATGQTARSAALATYTVGAADGTFEVSGNVNVTASTTHSFSLDVAYTDETNTAQTLILPMAQLAGAFVTGGLITNVTGTGPYESPVLHIRCKAATSITIRPSNGTYTSVTYNCEAIIKQTG